MAALGTIKKEGYKIDYWEYTCRVTLPDGSIAWFDSYNRINEQVLDKLLHSVKSVFNAGKTEQQRIIRTALGIRK